MRVLYFHQHFTTPAGSGGTRSYEFARALIARGHEVIMVCGCSDRARLNLPWDDGRRYSRGRIDGIDVIALPLAYSNRDSLLRRTWVFLRYALRSAKLAMTEKHDLLFATSTPLTAGIPGLLMKCAWRPQPFVFEVRDLWPELPRALGMSNPLALGGMGLLEWLCYRASDACIGLSPGIVEGIKKRARPAHPITMIPNGCDLELFRPGKRADLRLAGIKETDFAAVFTGAHGSANGLEALLDAAAELKRRQRTDIKLVFIGDGREKDRLIHWAQQEQLDNCLFLPSISKHALAELTGCFDCGLMILKNVPAFYHGTSPNKFFDYLSAGLPILCNYPGWLSEMIQKHQCGETPYPDDAAALADSLERLANNPALRVMYGRNSRNLAEHKFARTDLAATFVAFIEKFKG